MTSSNVPQQKWSIEGPSDMRISAPTPFASLPQPAPGYALIRLNAISINYRDHLIIAHSPSYPSIAKKGLAPGSDGAGVIVALQPPSSTSSTSEEAHLSVGDSVIVHPNPWLEGGVQNFNLAETIGDGETDGLLQRYATVPLNRLIRFTPSTQANATAGLTSDEAASIVTAGATAYSSLLYGLQSLLHTEDPLDAAGRGPVRDLSGWAGRSVLVQGTGGVSVFAAQLAVAAGARVIGTTSSATKEEFLRSIGVWNTVDYAKSKDWENDVLDLTDGKGVDFVLDVGGAGTIEKSLAAAKFGGVVVVVGILTESVKSDLVPAILFGAKTVRAVFGAGSAVIVKQLLGFMQEKGIKPVVAKTFEFEQAPEAYEYARTAGAIGKVVIRC